MNILGQPDSLSFAAGLPQGALATCMGTSCSLLALGAELMTASTTHVLVLTGTLLTARSRASFPWKALSLKREESIPLGIILGLFANSALASYDVQDLTAVIHRS